MNTAGLLGEQYIGLEAGGEEETLKNGDRISQTQDAVVLEKMISQFLYNKASESSEPAPAATNNAPAKSTESEDDALTANPLDKLTGK